MVENPSVLIIETSGSQCSVALTCSAGVVHRTLTDPLQHASHLAPLVRELILEASVSPSELHAVAVSIGPGSYTGLRIGVAFSKGLCQASGAPLIVLSTFEILRLSLFLRHSDTQGMPVMLCLPSKKDHLYIAAYSAEGKILIPPENYARDAWQQLAETLPENNVYAGTGAIILAEALGKHLERIISDVEPDAAAAVPLALNALKEGRFASLHEIEPIYLSGFNPRKAPSSFF